MSVRPALPLVERASGCSLAAGGCFLPTTGGDAVLAAAVVSGRAGMTTRPGFGAGEDFAFTTTRSLFAMGFALRRLPDTDPTLAVRRTRRTSNVELGRPNSELGTRDPA